jgi:hypothetical protein
MKLLDGVKEFETLSNLYYFCLDIIGKSNDCRRGPVNAEGCVDLELQYNNGIEKDKEFVKKFNNLLQHNKEVFSLESFCNNNNNIGQNHPDFLNFINLLIFRLEQKKKKYKRTNINYFSGQIIFSYIKKYIIDNTKIIEEIKYIPEKIITKIGKLIVPSQSLPAYSNGIPLPNYPPPTYHNFPISPSSHNNVINNSSLTSLWLGGSRKKKIQRKRKTKKNKK